MLSCFRFYLYEVEGMPRPPDDDGHFLGSLWARLKEKFGKADAPAESA